MASSITSLSAGGCRSWRRRSCSRRSALGVIVRPRQPRLARSSTALSSDRQDCSPGRRPITLVRRRVSKKVRSSRLVTGMKGRGCRLRPRIGASPRTPGYQWWRYRRRPAPARMSFQLPDSTKPRAQQTLRGIGEPHCDKVAATCAKACGWATAVKQCPPRFIRSRPLRLQGDQLVAIGDDLGAERRMPRHLEVRCPARHVAQARRSRHAASPCRSLHAAKPHWISSMLFRSPITARRHQQPAMAT